jgi:hypothetical protein
MDRSFAAKPDAEEAERVKGKGGFKALPLSSVSLFWKWSVGRSELFVFVQSIVYFDVFSISSGQLLICVLVSPYCHHVVHPFSFN